MIQTVGPYKQTGLAQIGPIHPPPSFSCQQAILRPYRFYNVRKKCGCPITSPHFVKACSLLKINNYKKSSSKVPAVVLFRLPFQCYKSMYRFGMVLNCGWYLMHFSPPHMCDGQLYLMETSMDCFTTVILSSIDRDRHSTLQISFNALPSAGSAASQRTMRAFSYFFH